MTKGPESVFDKGNMYVVISDATIPYGQPSDDFNLIKRNPWFSSFLVSSSPISRNSW